VGKKGYILGSDDDWDYYYTGEKGLTLPALGWVPSYIYRSSSIAIYHEMDANLPRVRCGIFKWLRAGWSGVNMVKKKHIYDGLKRFAIPFKEIMEYPMLPSAEALASDFSRIRNYSKDTLRSKMETYSNILRRRYNDGYRLTGKWPANLFEDKSHWAGMTKKEMRSALVVEYMKSVIGKTSDGENAALFEFK
jgi:hypothetical protein